MYLAKHIGRYGEPIIVPKFETMYEGAEDDLEKIVKKNGFGRDDKPKDDPRIIPSRRWIRRLFLDELPQIPYNLIWKRNMKAVGIRSKSENYWKNYPKQHKKRALNSPDYCGFLGVHRYNPKRTGIENERRYLAEKKIKCLRCTNKFSKKTRSGLVDLKYGMTIIYNIITGKTKGA